MRILSPLRRLYIRAPLASGWLLVCLVFSAWQLLVGCAAPAVVAVPFMDQGPTLCAPAPAPKPQQPPPDAIAELACNQLVHLGCRYWFEHFDCVTRYRKADEATAFCVANALATYDATACGVDDCAPGRDTGP